MSSDSNHPNEAENNENDEDVPFQGSMRSRRRGDIGAAQNSSAWLISFTDIMALMLTFFVLLYAMSSPTEESWSEMIAALQREFHQFYGPPQDAGPEDTINLDRVNFNQALSLEYLQRITETHMSGENALENVDLTMLSDRLIVSMTESLLFPSGQVMLSDEGREALVGLGTVLRRMKNRIEIVGHADPTPIRNPDVPYSSNWELSLERATTVAVILTQMGYNRPISIRGEGALRYGDTPEALEDASREALARRVDIHIMPDDGERSMIERLELRAE